MHTPNQACPAYTASPVACQHHCWDMHARTPVALQLQCGTCIREQLQRQNCMPYLAVAPAAAHLRLRRPPVDCSATECSPACDKFKSAAVAHTSMHSPAASCHCRGQPAGPPVDVFITEYSPACGLEDLLFSSLSAVQPAAQRNSC